MAARCHSSFRTVRAVAQLTTTRGLAPQERLQHFTPASTQARGRSVSYSSTLSSTTYIDSSSVQHARPQAEESSSKPVSIRDAPSAAASKTKEDQRSHAQEVLNSIPFDTFMRLVAPETYSGDFTEARNLEEVFAGAAQWASPKLAVLASQPAKLRSAQLRDYLSRRHIGLDTFVSLRNAMLSQSWPDIRRHMINIADGKWPAHVLQRAIHTVSTPSEISDSLALLASTIQHTSTLPRAKRAAAFKSLRYCFASLMTRTLKEHGGAFHLIPRLTDVLLALLQDFPSQVASSDKFIFDFTQRCASLPDERARQAVLRVLGWLRGAQYIKAYNHTHDTVMEHCIHSIENSMQQSQNRSASSELFANVELMEHFLQRDVPADSTLQQRALRCAVFVAGRGRDYRRTWDWFNKYQQLREKQGTNVTASDYLLLAKALVRTQQGRKDAWRVFLQAERLLSGAQMQALTNDKSHKVKERESAKELASTCIGLFEVMAKSTDVHLEKVLAMLGIFIRGTPHAEGMTRLSGTNSSQAMMEKRADVYAYSMVMQGCLLRQRPQIAVTVWQVMLKRGVLPNAASLSLLLQNLFQMRDVASALQQLRMWCEEGVAVPPSTRAKFKDVEVESLTTPPQSQSEALSTSSLTSTDEAAERHQVIPDPMLASVVFSGLHSCGLNGIEALWSAYQQTIRLFPDAPVLALLLKTCCRDETTSRLDARFGRQVFRTMLFAKHPELEEYRNPLREQLEAHGTAGWIFSHDTVGARMEQWLSSAFHSKEVDPPVATGDLGGLVFTSKLFEHYVRLLLHLQHSPDRLVDARAFRQELVDILGWMKELHLTPTPTHLALTVLEIEEHLLPAVAARQMDVLDAWLAKWLGAHGLPPEEVMQRHWRWKMERNGQRRGWFDRVTGPLETAPAGNTE